MSESDIYTRVGLPQRTIHDVQVIRLLGRIGSVANTDAWLPNDRTLVHYTPDDVQEAHYLQVIDNAGVVGTFGPIDRLQAFYILEYIRPTIRGTSSLPSVAEETLTNVYRHQGAGLHQLATSALDCALWDLAGNQCNLPVWAMLGKKQRNRIPAYASLLAHDVCNEAAPAVAAAAKGAGYQLQKWALRPPKQASDDWVTICLTGVEAIRQQLGETYSIALDAFGKLNAEQLSTICTNNIAQTLTWLEDPVPPSEFNTLSLLGLNDNLALAMGEELYSASDSRRALQSGVLKWYTPDVAWNGGISGIRSRIEIASVLHIPTALHGAGLLPALHIAAVSDPCSVPFVEFHVTLERIRQLFLKHQHIAIDGEIAVPDTPGLGIQLDPARAVFMDYISFE